VQHSVPVNFVLLLQEAQSNLTVKAIKAITDSASTKPYLIDHLHTLRIDGRAYLGQLESEMERPLLMLNVA